MALSAASSPLDQAIRAHQTGQWDRAESLYRLAMSLDGDLAQAVQFLGVLCCQTGRLAEGVVHLERAAALLPTDSEAHSNLGNAYRLVELYEDGVRACRRAVEVDPSNSGAWANLSPCLRALGRLGEAVKAASTAATLAPGSAVAHNNLGHALLASGEVQPAIAAFRRALSLFPKYTDALQGLLFAMLYSDQTTDRDVREQTERLGATFGDAVLPGRTTGLRTIGYVSGDWRRHPVGRFMLPVLRHHDRSSYRIVAFADQSVEDEVTREVKGLVDEWHCVRGLSASAVCDLVRQAEVDILIDLSGHSAGNRLDVFAQGAAPVQATWLGYSGSSGLAAIDWLIGDALVTPPEVDWAMTEKAARLPGAFLVADPTQVPDTSSPLPALKNGHVTFGSFNNLPKVSDSALRAWLQILEAVPGSRLILKSQQISDEAVLLKTRKRLEDLGFDLARVQLVGGTPDDEHWQWIQRADIALDSFPYNGATTTVDCLLSGVPVVSLAGDRYSSRMGASLLKAAGRWDWVAESVGDYIDLASGLASQLVHLAELRRNLRAQVVASPLCDAPAFVKGLESTFEDVWAHSPLTLSLSTPML
ncbi:MAG: tetratricopeptide repeat protein [Fimbriimonadaceae bacterium]|nr:tetratricopeptide repeat protein [Fimbriimonadaceae bacterium]